MQPSKQDRWNRSNAKDSFFNVALVGIALLVVAQAVIGGNVENEMPRHGAAITVAQA